MAKKIRVVTYRMCCQLEDLVDADKKPLGTLLRVCPDILWCRHCGTKHVYHSFTDAAGSRDWTYRPVRKKKK